MRSPDEQAVAAAIISLMREVVYRDVPAHEPVWEALARHRAAIADHFADIGVDVVVDETEGYAYLRTREPDEGEEPLPRLVRRRSLTYNVSLLLVLLRRRMVEFEASGEAGKLVLTRDQIIDLLRVFQASSTNEARVVEQADRTISQVAELGFLRELRGQRGAWEVRRILKAYVDAQTLADFAARLSAYAGTDKTTDAAARAGGAGAAGATSRTTARDDAGAAGAPDHTGDLAAGAPDDADAAGASDPTGAAGAPDDAGAAGAPDPTDAAGAPDHAGDLAAASTPSRTEGKR